MDPRRRNLFKPTEAFPFCIFIFIFTSLASQTTSLDQKFEACVPRNCGKGPNISYPFWIDGLHKPFCGYPNFKIECDAGNYPVLAIAYEDYIIKDIFYQNHSFLLASAAVYEEEHSCPSPSHNISLTRTPFQCTTDDYDFLFFYDCPSKPNVYVHELSCASNDTHYSFATFHKELLEVEQYPLNSCDSWVRVPIRKNQSVGLFDLSKMNYVEILKMGFILNWTAQSCSDCEQSGGHCGFENNEFLCFCSEGSHFVSCKHGRRIRNKIIIGTCTGFGGLFLTLVALFIWYRRRRHHDKTSHTPPYLQRSVPSDPSSVQELEKGGTYFGIHLFSYKELEEATNHFDSSKELGDGGFGTVYYGLLKDGRAVAVKRLYENNFKRVEQFMNEVEILTRRRHKNLVSLYGCTSRHSRELLLVYEYVPNGTVADHLHGELAKPGKLPWPTRMKIAIETANALVYLHASEIIHRDVKTNNILLDNDYCVKVADFGLSRLFPLDVTHVSTAPQGTPGYVDPEYHQCYQLTDKSDVFSFGVVLVELISSKPAVDITRHRHEINLFNMAISKIQNRALHELVDPSLGFESDYKIREMITSTAELAFRCLQSVKDMRPSMAEVFETLSTIQNQNSCKEKQQEMDIAADEAVLLKNSYGSLPLSPPSSLSVSWVSTSTATNETVSGFASPPLHH